MTKLVWQRNENSIKAVVVYDYIDAKGRVPSHVFKVASVDGKFKSSHVNCRDGEMYGPMNYSDRMWDTEEDAIAYQTKQATKLAKSIAKNKAFLPKDGYVQPWPESGE